MGKVEAIQEKIARLMRERDEMATQAAACAEEVDRVRVEIGAVQAENERLKIIIRDREWKRDLAEKEVDQLTTALAESERKRVECLGTCPEVAMANAGRAEAQAAHLRSLDHLAALGDDLHRAKTQAVQLVDLRRAGERYGLTLGQADILWSGALEARTARLATPTQETSHVES